MALEAVVYPKEYPFSYGCKDFYSVGGGGGASWGCDFISLQDQDHKAFLETPDHNHIDQQHHQQGLHENWDYCSSSPSLLQNNVKDSWEYPNNSSPEACTVDQSQFPATMETPPPPPPPPPPPAAVATTTTTTTSRRKRRRTRSSKNKEEIENQRMTHIVVERNRRKQMNEYLAVLRSLMPPSYVQRGDQASIIGGAINFVKEMEQLLQSMDSCSHKRTKKQQQVPLAEFLTFPQFSTRATQCHNESMARINQDHQNQNQWEAAADIEVTMVDSHANLKILSKKRPRQLLKMVAGFQSLRLSVLHLNVTTVDEMVLYSVSVKIEEGCMLNTVDEIAGAVNEMLRRIQEASFS